MGDTLNADERLDVGQKLTSPNGKYELTLQQDGNLVLSEGGNPVWATGTNGKDTFTAGLQKDGNFVLYNKGGQPEWSSNTSGNPGAKLVLQDDRNVVVLSGSGSSLWNSGTAVAAPAAAPAPAPEAAPAPVAPTPAPQPTPAPAAPAQVTYTVVHGDTLSAISKRFYGHANEYMKIAHANNIPNPDRIFPGQVLVIPQ